MGSRERDSTTTTAPPPHQHHLSSLVVRPAESGGGGSDYEPGEVRRDPPPYSRPDRFPENSGHGIRAGSGSPMRHRKSDYHHNRSDFDSAPHRGRGFRGGRGPGRFRDSSPPYGRGRGGGRPSGRDFDGPGFGPGPFRGEGGMSRNNPNVSPREGDWICPDPSCGNLNFARREHCNNCNRLRIGPRDSPRRNYPGPPRFSGLPMDHSPGRGTNGYRSSPPPRGWGRDGPREFGSGPPHSRHGGRFIDHHVRRERPDFREEEDYRERAKFDRPIPPEWNHRGDRGRDNFKERRGFDGRNDRRPLSPAGTRRPLSPPGPRRPLSPPGSRRPLSPPGPRRPLSPPLLRRPLSPPGPRRLLSPPGPRRPLSPPGPRCLLSSPGPRRPLSPPGQRRPLSPPGQRRPLSPPGPPPPARGRWPRDTRERSRSPIRNGGPLMDYRRDSYMDRGRDSRWGMVRDRVDEPPF